ncbi:MAG: UPF0261 family protein, partial [Lachnospiraceae bacterium]|nr:UPF0261 family protein [Lachnospiraceae bacterium]
VVMVDTGISPKPEYPCQVTASEVAKAGGASLEEIKKHDRLYAFQIMGNGSAKILNNLCREGKINGAISLGGGQGTLLASMVMKALPIGFPKLIVSTIANLRTPPFEGVRDTLVMNSLVDVSGLNHILKTELSNAAAAMAGLVLFGGTQEATEAEQKKTVGLTMFGVTTPCVDHVREILEKKGYEAIVFHANGQGGKRLEEMVREGLLGAVADITTGELMQELLGGNCSAGKDRLTAAPQMGIPQVIVPGAMDLANFMPPSSLPEKYEGRPFYMHNPNLKLLRANGEESETAGRILAEKVNASKGPVAVLLPKKGISQYDSPGGPLEDREADERLFASLKKTLRPDIRLLEYDLHINAPQFAEAVAEELIKIY